jgi:hypothetical protein
MRKEGRTDMKKLMVNFRSFANVPKETSFIFFSNIPGFRRDA